MASDDNKKQIIQEQIQGSEGIQKNNLSTFTSPNQDREDLMDLAGYTETPPSTTPSTENLTAQDEQR